MAGYDYNINLNVIVKDKQLNILEKRLQKMNNMTISPKFKADNSGMDNYFKNQSNYLRSFQREQTAFARNMTTFSRDFSRSAADLNRSFSSLRGTNSLGRRMGVAREKGSRLMDVGAGVGSYIGISSLKKILYDIPVQAETNKWLMSTMGDETASSNALYKMLDTTTDRLPISMQSVAQPLYAFKAATGENAETIKDIIPQFANFGAVVQNMTGSTELAETAMMKLGYGIKGRYAALDQYGITEDALKRAGWSGDENDVKGYMAAVTKIVGNAEDSMGTFAGRVKLVEKSLARTGKQIWESGVGDALKGVLTFVSAFLEAGNGMFAKLGVGAVALTTTFLGVTAASGYLLQAIGSMGESFLILKEAVGDAANWIGTKFHATSSVRNLEKTLTAQQTPMYVAGIHDYTARDIRNSGFSDKEKNKIATSKRRDKNYIKQFGYGAEYQRQRKAILSDKTLKGKEKSTALRNLRKSRLNEINNMGMRGRIREAGRIRSIKAIGGGFKQGWVANTGISKLTGGFSQMGSVLGSLVGVINPVNVVLGAFALAIGGLALVFGTAYLSSEQFRQHVSKVGQKLMDLGQTFMGVVGDIFAATGLSTEGGIQGVVEVADNILSAIESGFDWLKGVMEGFTGKDYKAEEGYADAAKTLKEAQAQRDEYVKSGKEVPQEVLDTIKWAYDRQAYFSAPNKDMEAKNPTQGGYWKEKYKQMEEQNPGWTINPYSNPKEVLKQNSEYLKGDLGIPFIGQERTYNPDVAAQQKADREQKSFAFFPLQTMLAKLLTGGLDTKEASSKAGIDEQQTTQAISDPMLNKPEASLDRLEVSADAASSSLDQISGVDTSSIYERNDTFNLTTSITGDISPDSIVAKNKEAMEQFKNDTNIAVSDSYGSMGSTIDSYSPQVGSSASNVGNAASNQLNASMGGMSSIAENQTSKVAGGINAKKPGVTSAVSQMKHESNSAFSGLDWASKVNQEIEYIKSNILGSIPSVTSAISQLVQAGNTQQQTDMQAHSPGIMARRYGKEVSYMAMLIRKNSPMVTDSVSALVKSANDVFNPIVGTMSYDTNPVKSLLSKNPVDIYNTEVRRNDVGGTPSVAQSDKKPPQQDNSQVINLTFNVEKIDSEERVREIKDVIYKTLLFNNETAGRTDPTGIT